MDGFKRPARPQNRPLSGPRLPDVAPPSKPGALKPAEAVLPKINLSDNDTTARPPVKRPKKRMLITAGIIVVLIAAFLGVYAWFAAQLQPVNQADDSVQRIEIKEGSSLGYVAQRLEERGLIRSGLAFKILANVEGKQSAMKVGACSLTPADSSQVILDKIIEGCQDFKAVLSWCNT